MFSIKNKANKSQLPADISKYEKQRNLVVQLNKKHKKNVIKTARFWSLSTLVMIFYAKTSTLKKVNWHLSRKKLLIRNLFSSRPTRFRNRIRALSWLTVDLHMLLTWRLKFRLSSKVTPRRFTVQTTSTVTFQLLSSSSYFTKSLIDSASKLRELSHAKLYTSDFSITSKKSWKCALIEIVLTIDLCSRRSVINSSCGIVYSFMLFFLFARYE